MSVDVAYRVGDGVTIRLLDGETVHAKALTVSEALDVQRALVGLTSASVDEHTAFCRSFAPRIGVADVALSNLGFRLAPEDGDEIDLHDLTVSDALYMVELLGAALEGALVDPFAERTARAQVRVLDEFPKRLGLEPRALSTDQYFALARTFRDALYRMIYGLAQGFYSALIARPPIRALTVRAVTRPVRPCHWRNSSLRSST